MYIQRIYTAEVRQQLMEKALDDRKPAPSGTYIGLGSNHVGGNTWGWMSYKLPFERGFPVQGKGAVRYFGLRTVQNWRDWDDIITIYGSVAATITLLEIVCLPVLKPGETCELPLSRDVPADIRIFMQKVQKKADMGGAAVRAPSSGVGAGPSGIAASTAAAAPDAAALAAPGSCPSEGSSGPVAGPAAAPTGPPAGAGARAVGASPAPTGPPAGATATAAASMDGVEVEGEYEEELTAEDLKARDAAEKEFGSGDGAEVCS